ncbi:BTA121 domain-containing protein surface lipoprotein, partial [Borrelia crocidurae]|uniref:BTA121 domain-containing protein surface lipoprotein n=1 Tax=Borrelia crocidurae TaxID=29520 RepID=UPI00059B2E40
MSQKRTLQTIKEQLSEDEKIALNFFEDLLVRRNEDEFRNYYGLDKNISFPYGRYSKFDFDEFVVIMDSEGLLKLALLFIMSTLNSRAAVKYVMEHHHLTNKNIWADRFKKETIEYFRCLIMFTRGKPLGYTSERLRMFHDELISISKAPSFGKIAKDIIDSLIIKQLDEDQRDALKFFEKAVPKSVYNPAYPSKQAFYPVIAYLAVDNLKRALSKIVTTLHVKKIAEQVLSSYIGIKKDIFNKMLKDSEGQYERYLGSILNANSLHDVYYNLSREIDVPRFKSIASSITYYINEIKFLNDEETDALNFFEGSITELNPDDPDDHKLITHAKEDFYLLLEYIGIDNLQFQKFLSSIVVILNAIKVAEKTIKNYDSSIKDMLIQKLRNAKASYIKYLKNICNTSSFDEIYNNLSI